MAKHAVALTQIDLPSVSVRYQLFGCLSVSRLNTVHRITLHGTFLLSY